MVTTYNAIVAACPPIPGLGDHDMEVVSNDKFSFLLLCQPDWISFIVHCKLPEDQQCRWPNRKKYTEEEMEALAAKIASYPVNDSVVFGELWRNRTKAQLISLEEGVLDHWFFGRTVLAGDSIHKVRRHSLQKLRGLYFCLLHYFKLIKIPLYHVGNAKFSIGRLHSYGKRRQYRERNP